MRWDMIHWNCKIMQQDRENWRLCWQYSSRVIMLTFSKLEDYSPDCIQSWMLFCWQYANTNAIQTTKMACSNVFSAVFNQALSQSLVQVTLGWLLTFVPVRSPTSSIASAAKLQKAVHFCLSLCLWVTHFCLPSATTGRILREGFGVFAM